MTPLLTTRLTLHTGADLLTEVKATWGIYRRMITAYREPDRAIAKQMMRAVIASIRSGVPEALEEVITLGRTLRPARR